MSRALALACLVAASVGCDRAPAPVVYDLAQRLPVAERWSQRQVLLFGTPAAEPHQADGFYREAGGSDGDSFAWARGEAEVSLTWAQPEARAAILDLAPYSGLREQGVELRLNGSSLGRFALNPQRHRYRLPLPAEAQRPGDNRLRFVFAATGSPADQDPKSGDKRRLAAAFYALVVGSPADAGLDDLLARDAPAPFALSRDAGVPALTLAGPAGVRYALRMPAQGELRLAPLLHAAARAAGASATFKVTLEERAGEERELWSRTLGPRDRPPGEVRLALPARAGAIIRLGLHVTGERFAWGTWGAPRVLGRGAADPLAPALTAGPEAESARALREGLAGSNVLLVLLDAGRARQLGCYGYGRPTTPNLDRIAAEGVRFESVFTPAVYTLGAMSSLWTSQHPDRHHSEVSFSARLPKDRLTLAEVLGARGVHTAGFVANAVAGSAFGFDRGFSEFHELYKTLGSGGGAFRKVLPAWLAQNASRRFFLYLHFREPHFPYDPAPPFDTRFGPDGPIPKPKRSDSAFFTDVNQGRRGFSAEERDHLVRLYDGNLAFADQELGELRRLMEQAGTWEKTVVIVAADHGEGLLEHGWIGHNVQVYDESTQVPLILRFPRGKGPAGLRLRGLADLLDVAPTVADVFGVLGQGGTDREFEGRSLLPMVAGAPGKPAVLSRTVWDRPIYALRDDAWKLIYDTRTGEQQLFDLVADPGETRDLAAAEPLRSAYYREALHNWTLGLGRRRHAASEAEGIPTREQCENMKTLGYIPGDFKCPDD